MIKKNSSSKPRTAQMMNLSLVAMTGLEKCCITSSYLQWLLHSGERVVARGPLVFWSFRIVKPIPRFLTKPMRVTGES